MPGRALARSAPSALCTLSLLFACAAEPEPELGSEPEPSRADSGSSYLCLETVVEGALCPANAAILDAQVEFIAAYLGLPLPDECVPTLWAEDVSAECGPHKGCYREGRIWSSWQTMSHEIVHAMVDNAGLGGSVFMWEGLAEALSGKVLRSRGLGLAAILEVGQGGSLSGAEYESAGHLLSWMLGELGPETVIAIYERLHRDMTTAEVIAVFEELSGEPFASLEEAYGGARSTIYAGRGPFACGAAATPLRFQGDVAEDEAYFSCRSEAPFRRLDLGHAEELWRPYLLEHSGGALQIELGAPLSAHGLVQACLVEDTEESRLPEPPSPVLRSWGRSRGHVFFGWREPPEELAVPGGLRFELPAGTYTFWFGQVRELAQGKAADPRQSFSITRRH